VTRRIEPWVPAEGRALLDQLLGAVGDPQRYRAAMVGLGRVLAGTILAGLSPKARVAVVCTAEDADFLARGFVELASDRLREPRQVALVCFWNDRQRLPGNLDIAPILRRYVEPIEAPLDALIVLKSVVADGCTVKTNIQELLATVRPARVIVAAPVILRGAADRVREDFAPAVAAGFEFVVLAEDDARTKEGWVDPGIGGEVYRLLGLGSKADATRYRPELVDERRELLHL
jgi:hypothetical protein